jgi:hypothetical protein
MVGRTAISVRSSKDLGLVERAVRRDGHCETTFRELRDECPEIKHFRTKKYDRNRLYLIPPAATLGPNH